LIDPEADKLEADLSAYLDEELNEEERQAVERRLAQSEDCRRLLAELREVRRQLAALPRRRAPEGLPAAIARQTAARFSGRRTSRAVPRIVRVTLRLSAAAAVAVAAVWVGYRALRWPATPNRTQTGREETLILARRSGPEKSLPQPGREAELDNEQLRETARPQSVEAERPAGTGSLGTGAGLDVAGPLLVPGGSQPAVCEPGPTEPDRSGPPVAIAVSEPQETPRFNVIIEAPTQAQHQRLAALLARWSDTAVAGDPTTFQMNVGELSSRIGQLLEVSGRSEVRVEGQADSGTGRAVTYLAHTFDQPSELAEALPPALQAGAGRKAGQPATPALRPAGGGKVAADRAGPESKLEEVRRRHAEAVTEPPVTIVFQKPPGPLTQTGGGEGGREPVPTAAPSQPVQTVQSLGYADSREKVIGRLMELLLKGRQGAAREAHPAEQPKNLDYQVRFRVVLLPPAPASSPAAPEPP